MIELSESKVYEFDAFRLDAKSHRLFRRQSGELVPLTPKAVELLLVLVQNKGHVVTKDQLLEAVWDNSFVEESNLSQTIFVLRKALGENTKVPRFILTAPNRGYQFIATVKEVDTEDAILDESFLSDTYQSLDGHGPKFEVRKSLETTFSPIRSLAVLPLKNLTGDPTNDYLSDGMSESLTVSLSRIDDLTVIAHTSSVTYKNKEIDFAEVGNRLNVETILIGSIQKEEQALRVNVRLIRVLDGRILWANEFFRPAREIFALQDDIARYLFLKINPTVDDQAALNFERRYTNNPDVYEFYLKGRYFWLRRISDDVSKGLRLFQQAIALDPNYAPAYVGISDSYIVQSNFSIIPSTEGFPKARAAVIKALEIDEQYGEAHRSLARIKMDFDRDRRGAEIEFKRALELNPNHASSYHWYAKFLSQEGRLEESIRKFKRASELDPLSLTVKADSSLPYFAARDFEQALSILFEALEMDPRRPSILIRIGECYLHSGKTNEALEAFQKARQLDDSTDARACIAYVFAITNQKNKAEKLLNEMIEQSEATDTAYYEIASVYTGLNEVEKVFEWLEKAYQTHAPSLSFLAIDPRFDNLHSNPQFQDLILRVGISRSVSSLT